jgi:hypothetical protein
MFKKGLLSCSMVLMALLCFGLAAGPACADQIFHAAGASPDGDVVAQADVTAGNGTITIVLTNLLPNERSIGQAISDFGFTVVGGTVTSASVTSAMGTAENITGTNSHGNAPPTTTRWVVDQQTGNNIHFTTISGGQPNYLIAGIPDANGNYPNENASMEVHSPVFVESATFVLAVTGVTASSTVTDVEFSFGTGPDFSLPGQPGPVPEPSSIILLSMGAIFLVSLARLPRRRSTLA